MEENFKYSFLLACVISLIVLSILIYRDVTNKNNIIEKFYAGGNLMCQFDGKRSIVNKKDWKIESDRFVNSKEFFNINECSVRE